MASGLSTPMVLVMLSLAAFLQHSLVDEAYLIAARTWVKSEML